MKTRVLVSVFFVFLTGALFLLVADSGPTLAQYQNAQTSEKNLPVYRRSIEDYRTAIKDTYHVDIANFKDRLKGGRADGKRISKYDLKELLEGIRFEREHTDDSLLALEMAMDHLETIPDYYSRLHQLEEEVMSDQLLSQ